MYDLYFRKTQRAQRRRWRAARVLMSRPIMCLGRHETVGNSRVDRVCKLVLNRQAPQKRAVFGGKTAHYADAASAVLDNKGMPRRVKPLRMREERGLDGLRLLRGESCKSYTLVLPELMVRDEHLQTCTGGSTPRCFPRKQLICAQQPSASPGAFLSFIDAVWLCRLL